MPAIAAKQPEDMTQAERVEQTVLWFLSGSRDAHVLESIQHYWPGQDLQPLLQAAAQQLIESAETDPAIVRCWCFEATKMLFERMVSIGDFAGALRAVKLLHELAGK